MKDYCNTSIFANYFRGLEAVGGKLYFDNTGMTFKSHAFNLQTGETRIEYKTIVRVAKRNALAFIPNGLSVFTSDGYEHKFVIYHRKDVIAFLQTRL